MDAKLLVRNYLWPLILAGVNGLFLWLAQSHPEAFSILEAAGIGPIYVLSLVAAILGWIMAKWNPTAGRDQKWFVPRSKKGETPSLEAWR